MITGFNHNIKYKNVIFHVQTEDTGENKAYIITHLFIGGNIITSLKNSYKNVVNASQMRDIVKSMMEQQHKSVLKGLLNGKYDNEIYKMLLFMKSPNAQAFKSQENKNDTDIIKQSENQKAPHLIEDKQKSILDKNPKASEENLDELILSFLEKNL